MSRSLDGKQLAVLVHEVRSPVAALAAIADTFAGASIHGNDRAELAHLAVSACRSLQRIAVDALTPLVRHEAVDPGALVRYVVATATVGGSRVRADVASDLPAISGDPVRLQQALQNLVTNALVHAGSDALVTVSASVREGSVVLSVSDSGAGISVMEQERIFEAGERLGGGRPGSGLGLAIVRAIVEEHDGLLSVTSSPGEGATFTIALPAC